MRIISRSPIALVHRLKATPGKSDQKTLNKQYEKKIKIGQFALTKAIVRRPRWTRTHTAAILKTAKKVASTGLPSSWTFAPLAGVTPSHADTGLDPRTHR